MSISSGRIIANWGQCKAGNCPKGEKDPERHGMEPLESGVKDSFTAGSHMVPYPDGWPDEWVPDEKKIILKTIL